ncbi:uncharacterized protein LOC141833567 isoform X2 [Curcuma longa]|uniref:uncharacterized protein LOC141833567 isoform X2 n=1 Tax=Curcuma longa TaxID=136217 RepID=UPI003D9E5727
MEVVFLLCSAMSTFLTSSLLSLALAIRSIPLCFSCLRFDGDRSAAVLLYEGRVRHARRRPVEHAFEYSVRYALIDLDGSPQPSHLSAERAREIAGTNGPVFLLTIPENVGYQQNPLSVYYCYDVEEGKGEEGDGPKPSLKMCIAEVTNTPWGERDMQGNWCMLADAPGENLSLVISVQHPTLGNYFTATLRAKRVLSSSSSIFLEKFFWLMPHKVAVWIYWQAFKLWWKNTKFLDHPKYASSRYKDDAARRDRELRSGNSRQGEDLPTCSANMFPRDRWCQWQEAPWPWS